MSKLFDFGDMKNILAVHLLVFCLVAPFIARAEEEARRLIVFDFHPEADISQWEVEDDVVMGGRSEGRLTLNEAGHAVFSGIVSLENNGGFSSIQHHFPPLDISAFQTAHIRLKGDGKRYFLLVEAEPDAYHYYVGDFQTQGDWETVQIPLRDMVPVRRGDPLDLPNFSGETLAQVRIMIANQTRESFHLEIDRIWLE